MVLFLHHILLISIVPESICTIVYNYSLFGVNTFHVCVCGGGGGGGWRPERLGAKNLGMTSLFVYVHISVYVIMTLILWHVNTISIQYNTVSF